MPTVVDVRVFTQSLCGKTMKFEHVMKIVASVANSDLIHLIITSFNIFLSEIDGELAGVLYHM